MKSPINIEIPKWLPQHPWHPSVVCEVEEWNGHRWWMVETPFPPFYVMPYKDRWELPCVHYSDDGKHWKSAGAPIDDLTEEQIASHSYHSDPHLVMKDGVLHCYYRLMEDHDAKTTIIRKQSIDGVNWSEREIVIIDKDITKNIYREEIISPAIVWTGKKWRMYYVDDTFTNIERGIQMAESEDGVHFTHVGSVWEQQEVKPWHIDVQLIDGIYYLLVHDVDHNTLTLFDSADGTRWNNGKALLKASGNLSDFWSHKLYRACVVKADEGKQMYFSCTDSMASYVGVMRQDEQGRWEVVDCMRGCEKLEYVLQFCGIKVKQLVRRVTHFIDKRIRV